MQQIINFIIKNSYRLLFLLLLALSLTLTIKSHTYHRSEYINSANRVTGSVYKQLNDVNEYFSLKEKNKELASENALLKELLFNKKDTLITAKTLFRNDPPTARISIHTQSSPYSALQMDGSFCARTAGIRGTCALSVRDSASIKDELTNPPTIACLSQRK